MFLVVVVLRRILDLILPTKLATNQNRKKRTSHIIMATSFTVRVKRRIDEEPLDTFVLSCKRQKTGKTAPTDESEADDTVKRTVVKYAGTVDAEHNINEHLKKFTKNDAKELVKKIPRASVALRELRAEQNKTISQNNRFKVVNCYRAIDTETEEGGSDQTASHITVVDVIQEEAAIEEAALNDQTAVGSKIPKSSSYVYDYYQFDYGDALDGLEDVDLQCLPLCEKDLDFRQQPNEEPDQDSDDSNDEDNWRNDYPDTDDGQSIGDEDMRRAVDDLSFGSDNILSSDEESLEYGHDNYYSDDSDGELTGQLISGKCHLSNMPK